MVVITANNWTRITKSQTVKCTLGCKTEISNDKSTPVGIICAQAAHAFCENCLFKLDEELFCDEFFEYLGLKTDGFT